MEGEYEQIREQALQETTVGVSDQPDAAEPEGAEQSVEAMPQKATDAEQSVEVALQRSTELQLAGGTGSGWQPDPSPPAG